MDKPPGRTVRQEFPWGVIEWLAGAEVGNSLELSLARVSLPAGNATEMHVHGNCEESVYVVHGRVECVTDGAELTLAEGQQTVVLRGASHRLRNPGAQAAEVILSYSSAARDFVLAPDGASSDI